MPRRSFWLAVAIAILAYAPVRADAAKVTAIVAGYAHVCALNKLGGVKCWGANYYGELGDGSRTDRHSAVPVSGLASGVKALAAGDNHTCALTTAGGVKCWGNNDHGELGDGTTTNRKTPVFVSGLKSGVIAIAAGGAHTCALTSAHAVECWGSNKDGELGDGTKTDRRTPTPSKLTSGIIAVAGGDYHTCAVTKLGGVMCWGYNSDGQLGDGTQTARTSPVSVSGLTRDVGVVALGAYHSCALTKLGAAKCWGNNLYGQLGDGTTTRRLRPVPVVGLSSGVTDITGGYDATCAVTGAGGAKCTGNNFYGQLGDGTTTQRHTPVFVKTLTSGVKAVTAGNGHVCALLATGGVKCWGNNLNGQVGDGTTMERHSPVGVVGL